MIESAKSSIPYSLASSLEPALRKQTNNRLNDIYWFRTDWQRGGAATGFATWDGDAEKTDVVIKLPVNQRELGWTRKMQSAGGVVPQLFDSGEQLNGYDLTWMIIERFPVGPLGKHWESNNIARIAEAAARFTNGASAFPVDQAGRREDWSVLLRTAKKSVRKNHIQNEKSWKKENIYQKIQDYNKELPKFIFHDGPPYANGNIHLGHLLNKALKDFVVRSQPLLGKQCDFIPGWDCHGLPIEHKVMQELSKSKELDAIKSLSIELMLISRAK